MNRILSLLKGIPQSSAAFLRIGFFLLGVGFLVVCWCYSQNGRYVYIKADPRDEEVRYMLLDTRTGLVYYRVESEAVSLWWIENPHTGKDHRLNVIRVR